MKHVLGPLVRNLLETSPAESNLAQLMPLLGALLQFTDSFNFSILCKVRQLRHQSRQMLLYMLQQKDLQLAAALVRGFHVQPSLAKLIDTVPLFESGEQPQAMELQSEETEFDVLVRHLKLQVF